MRTDLQRFRFLRRQLGPLSSPRIVLLTGARQTGKTTLAREVYPDLAYLNLDAPEQREAIRAVRADAWANTPPYAANLTSSVVKSPKVYWIDLQG